MMVRRINNHHQHPTIAVVETKTPTHPHHSPPSRHPPRAQREKKRAREREKERKRETRRYQKKDGMEKEEARAAVELKQIPENLSGL